jgi:hypothetical protein
MPLLVGETLVLRGRGRILFDRASRRGAMCRDVSATDAANVAAVLLCTAVPVFSAFFLRRGWQ